MKKKYKYYRSFGRFSSALFLILLSLVLTLSLFGHKEVLASSDSEELKGIYTEGILRKEGVLEIRQTYLYDDRFTDGTEHFIGLNLPFIGSPSGKEDFEFISDYEVYLDKEALHFLSNWDIDASFEEKAGRYGLIDMGDEIELTFGITKNEINEFEVRYLVHNVIKGTLDNKTYLHYSFTPRNMNPKPDEMEVRLFFDQEEVGENPFISKIFAFNYQGGIYFKDEDRKEVLAKMDPGSYSSDNQMNIFVTLEDNGFFKKTSPLLFTLEEKAKRTIKGSSYDFDEFYKENVVERETAQEKRSIGDKIKDFLPILKRLSSFLAVGVIIIYHRRKNSKLRLIFGKKKIQKLKDKNYYFRDQPEKSLELSGLLREILPSINYESTLRYLLSKWSMEGVLVYKGRVNPELKESDVLFFIDQKMQEESFKSKSQEIVDLETEILEEFLSLKDEKGLISTRDFKKLSFHRLEYILSSFYKKMEKSFEVNEKKKDHSHLFNLLKENMGLKNFLSDFTLINERTFEEVNLWDYYFYLAALYGVDDAFQKQLDKFPKERLSEGSLRSYNRVYGHSNSALLYSSLKRSSSRAYKEYQRSKNSSSGGGGSSSSGGGGGFSGGGSSGGTR